MNNIRLEMPRVDGLDQSMALLSEGYLFIRNRRRRLGSDLFQTRLFAQNVICMSGKEAAELFYDEEKFERNGAALKRIQKTLLGEKGVQGLDGAMHRHRKKMFLSLMSPERLKEMAVLTQNEWGKAAQKWTSMDRVVLFDEVQELLCRAACAWSGVPIEEKEVGRLADDLGKMVDGFGAVGPRHWQGRGARATAEKWARELIRDVRAGRLNPPEGSAARVIAMHQEINGEMLDENVAAVELLNILRPIVAIATYITFGAHALHEHPAWREKLRKGEGQAVQPFVQEVRRYYPFTPFVGARVRKDFIWKDYLFPSGTLVLLDVYGLNHDPQYWDDPEVFRPERFDGFSGGPFDFLPQGGGSRERGHRCAGEWLTINVMEASLHFMVSQLDYDVPVQDLSIDLSRVPTLPKDRFVITHVRLKKD